MDCSTTKPEATEFQSTLPAWGETPPDRRAVVRRSISIHSPRMGRDPAFLQRARSTFDFNPLSPHGERLQMIKCAAHDLPFQSTLPAWGETGPWAAGVNAHRISIHSPRMGRDDDLQCLIGAAAISIHSPRMGRDGDQKTIEFRTWDFNPLSPHGERPWPLRSSGAARHFNPLSPHGERP